MINYSHFRNTISTLFNENFWNTNYKLKNNSQFQTLYYEYLLHLKLPDFTELRRNEMKKKPYTTPSEQFLIQIGNIDETEAISIPLTDKYMTSYVDHLS